MNPIQNKARQRSARRPAESRISEIKEAARAELAEKGYQNFQTAEVARRCGVSEATIYHYFPTKRELVTRVAEDWFEVILGRAQMHSSGADLHGRLREIVYDIFSIVRADPALTRFILLELRPDPAYPQSKIHDLNARFTARVAQLVSDGIQAGQFRNDISPKLVRSMIFGCMEHQTWGYLRGRGDFSPDESADGIASLIFRGLSVPTDERRVDPALARIESGAAALYEEIRQLKALLGSSRPAATDAPAARRKRR